MYFKSKSGCFLKHRASLSQANLTLTMKFRDVLELLILLPPPLESWDYSGHTHAII